MSAPSLAAGPARPRGRPRSELSRHAVLEATVQLLGEVGFDRLSMDAIARRAGASKATIYRSWRNKVAVVVEAIDGLGHDAVPEPDTGSLDGDIRSALASLLTAMRSPRGAMVEAVAAASQHHPDLQEALEQHFLAHRREMVGRILGRAAARGELREGTDKDLVADVIVGLLFYRIRLRPPARDSALVESFIQLLAEGLRRRPGQSR
jgi:AcrR family transcriptional regulator